MTLILMLAMALAVLGFWVAMIAIVAMALEAPLILEFWVGDRRFEIVLGRRPRTRSPAKNISPKAAPKSLNGGAKNATKNLPAAASETEGDQKGDDANV